MNTMQESSGPSVRRGWYKITLEVHPDGKAFQSTGGDYAPNPYGADLAPLADPIVRNWLQAYTRSLTPWYRRDRYGWPIETFKDRPIKSFIRLVCQNLRKLWPRRKPGFRATRTLGVARVKPNAKIHINE